MMLAFFSQNIKMMMLLDLIEEIIKNNDNYISFETMVKNNDMNCRIISTI